MFGDNAGMDTCKMIRMALLHDIVESITGDLTPEMTSKENKLAQEKIAIGKLNEMTTMINDKSKLDESNIKYVKSLFAELVHGGHVLC